jgi:peptidoglycan hydrolase FlgJ
MNVVAGNPGYEVQARTQAAADFSAGETPAHKKLVKAAQEFEGILISQLLGTLEGGMSSLGGDSSMAGSDTLNSLATQVLAGSLARRGGLGIGQIIIHQLEPSLHGDRTEAGGQDIKTASRD